MVRVRFIHPSLTPTGYTDLSDTVYAKLLKARVELFGSVVEFVGDIVDGEFVGKSIIVDGIQLGYANAVYNKVCDTGFVTVAKRLIGMAKVGDCLEDVYKRYHVKHGESNLKDYDESLVRNIVRSYIKDINS